MGIQLGHAQQLPFIETVRELPQQGKWSCL